MESQFYFSVHFRYNGKTFKPMMTIERVAMAEIAWQVSMLG